jgi:hypothetical protein
MTAKMQLQVFRDAMTSQPRRPRLDNDEYYTRMTFHLAPKREGNQGLL